MKLLLLYILKPDLEAVWRKSSDIWIETVLLEDSTHLGFLMVALKKLICSHSDIEVLKLILFEKSEPLKPVF